MEIEGKKRRLPVWQLVALIVAGVSLVGNAVWGVLKGFDHAVSVVAEGSRKKEAVKCTDSRIPYDVIPEIEAHEDKFPFEMIMALIYVESRGNPKARSPKATDNERHRGLMMVSIGHCKEYGIAEADLDIPRINVWAGLKVLIARKARWGKSKYQYICAFNCPDSAMKLHFDKGKRLPSETEIHWKRYQVEEARYGKLMRTGIWTER